MKYRTLIEQLGLRRHDEGGWFTETYGSPWTAAVADRPGGVRPGLTCIFYLLTADQPRARLHANASDIHIFFQAGSALRYLLVPPDGGLEERVLGAGLERGEVLQLTVPGGWWKAADLLRGEFCLIGEAVGPGFDYRDRRLLNAAGLQTSFPHLYDRLAPYTWE